MRAALIALLALGFCGGRARAGKWTGPRFVVVEARVVSRAKSLPVPTALRRHHASPLAGGVLVRAATQRIVDSFTQWPGANPVAAFVKRIGPVYVQVPARLARRGALVPVLLTPGPAGMVGVAYRGIAVTARWLPELSFIAAESSTVQPITYPDDAQPRNQQIRVNLAWESWVIGAMSGGPFVEDIMLIADRSCAERARPGACLRAIEWTRRRDRTRIGWFNRCDGRIAMRPESSRIKRFIGELALRCRSATGQRSTLELRADPGQRFTASSTSTRR